MAIHEFAIRRDSRIQLPRVELIVGNNDVSLRGEEQYVRQHFQYDYLVTRQDSAWTVRVRYVNPDEECRMQMNIDFQRFSFRAATIAQETKGKPVINTNDNDGDVLRANIIYENKIDGRNSGYMLVDHEKVSLLREDLIGHGSRLFLRPEISNQIQEGIKPEDTFTAKELQMYFVEWTDPVMIRVRLGLDEELRFAKPSVELPGVALYMEAKGLLMENYRLTVPRLSFPV